ncbi:MAG TPA: F0F1 ATP synthase subunit epsilon [Candidatus Acidoferrales bacterium]|jgi:F-type H+-transporting ATPase subunit epsilon|nr:F0F1 ATP synthase subunit epsilon [Candidatus Acidoferrales bacterium]
MADTFTLEVVTPARQVVREAVNEAQIPLRNGYIGVLPGHTPLLAELGMGELSYQIGGRTFYCTAFGGFVEVLADRTIVLADRAERAEEIDVRRAEAARDRAQKRMSTVNDPTVDWKRAEVSLARAETRLQVAAKAGASPVASSVSAGH